MFAKGVDDSLASKKEANIRGGSNEGGLKESLK